MQEQFFARHQALAGTDSDTEAQSIALQKEMIASLGNISSRYVKTMPGSCVATYALANWLNALVGSDDFDEAAALVTEHDMQYPIVSRDTKTDHHLKTTRPGPMITDFTALNGTPDRPPVSLSASTSQAQSVLVPLYAA